MARAFVMVPAASREEPDQKDREIERAEVLVRLNFVDDSISYQARAFSLRP
ncbi:hypothetical protein T03_14702 [Trichinella britovi]|uniref:Uncharacterized protein n=1 Tax=Trichinella britovi TaxID=45882 RepID=A0A0V1D397_TRIBR|nr:hypothetical protein T03_14702 [Trichinella britovi]